MAKEHTYNVVIQWTGNTGNGTSDYRAYERSHVISAAGKPDIDASSDVAFRGQANRYNPEELLVASLSSCHMLWFLHLCADNGIVVVDYVDHPTGTMIESKSGGGKFKKVVLHPTVTIEQQKDLAKLCELHIEANKHCFIANSVNFPVTHQAVGIVVE